MTRDASEGDGVRTPAESTALETWREPAGTPTERPPLEDVEDARLFALVRARMFKRGEELRIGRYHLQRRLGAGAMGEVHQAHDEELDRPVAIKFVHRHLTSERWAARLRIEAQALARLDHPNVVGVYEVGSFEGRVFVAMKYVEGRSLRDWIRAEKPGWAAIVRAYVAAGRGLAAAHGAGVVHRDFKPDNVLRGEDGRVAVADFGLATLDRDPARALEAAHAEAPAPLSIHYSRTGEIKGTPAYMPPEQFQGVADARADQFALCVAIYEGLWARRPFPNRSVEELRQADSDWTPRPPPREGEAPKWIWPILARGLARDPEARWPSVDELIAALERGLERPRRRRLILRSAAAAVAVGLLSGLAVAWLSEPEPVDDCTQLATELGETWDANHQRQLSAVFDELAAKPGQAWLAESEAPVVAGLERWRERWLSSRRELCESRSGGDPVVLDHVASCLERQRRSTEALVDLMLSGEPGALREAPEAVQRLGDPRDCAEQARAGGPAAPPPAIAASVAGAREQLAELEAERMLARDDRALAGADALRTEVEALDYPPLLAELELLRGRALLASDPEAAFEALEQAADLAEAARHDRVVAEAWRVLATVAATELPDLERGHRWLRRAEAAMKRVGVDDRGRAQLDFVRGDLDEQAKEFETAREHLESARAGFESAGDQLGVALANESLAVTAMHVGDTGRALELFELALDQRGRVHGPRHPEVAAVAYNFGNAAMEIGEVELAQSMLERAVDIWAADETNTDLEVGKAQTALAHIALASGEFEQCLDYAEAATAAYTAAKTAARGELAEAAALEGSCLYFLGRHGEATVAHREAVRGYTEVLGADSVYVAYFELGLAWALLATGGLDEAGALFESSRATIEEHGTGDSDLGRDAHFGQIAVALARGNNEFAERELEALAELELRPLEAVEHELFLAVLELRRDPDGPAGVARLARARELASEVPAGPETVANLLASVGVETRGKGRPN